MLRPEDYLILKIFTQVVEIIAVPCHPDNKITVQLRVFLRFPQGGSIDHIELYMVPVKCKITADQRCEAFVALLVFEKLRSEFLIQQCSTRPQVIDFGS